MRGSALADRAFFFMALAVAAAAFVRPLWDPDTYWHLAVGREMAWRGGLIRAETFSFTASGAPWEDTEWLFHAAIYLLSRVGGETILISATALLGLAALAQMGRLVRSAGGGGLAFSLASMAILPVLANRVRCRPDIVTLLFLGILLGLLWSAEKELAAPSVDPRFAKGCLFRLGWKLAVLFAVWVNFHGGWAYGAALLAAWASGILLDFMARRFRPPLPWAGLLAAAGLPAAALFVNPYGWRLPWFPFRSLIAMGDRALIPIQEWSRTPLGDYRGVFIAISFFFLLFLVARKARWASILPAALQVALSLLWVRYPPFGFFLLAPMAAREILPLVDRTIHRYPLSRVAATLASLGLGLLMGTRYAPEARLKWDLSSLYPVAEARFLQENRVSGNLLHTYQAGGFLDWYYWPLGRTFMDGRFFPFTSVLADYFDSMKSVDGFEAFLDRRGVEIASHPYPPFKMEPEEPGVPPRGLFHYFYPKERWAAVAFTNYGGLFLKRLPKWEALIERREYRAFSPDETGYWIWRLERCDAGSEQILVEAARCLAEAPRNPYGWEVLRLTAQAEGKKK